MEAYDYSDLHKIILGVHPLEVADAIARNPVLGSQVNKPIVVAVTPAYLAAIRGSRAQLAALKQAEADLSYPNVNKSTPLHAACTNQRSSAAQFILNTERMPDATTTIGMTPLHCIVSTPNQIRTEMWDVADRLLELGADIDARAICDVTPLMYAANADTPKAITYLISRGANINARDVDGDMALVEAIFSNLLECVRMLLGRGADVKAVNKYGRGPLHYLAGTGSGDIIDVFQVNGALSRQKLNKYEMDKYGLAPINILNRRPNLSEGLREKFRRLLNTIPDYVVSGSDDETWEDSSTGSDSEEEQYSGAKEDFVSMLVSFFKIIVWSLNVSIIWDGTLVNSLFLFEENRPPPVMLTIFVSVRPPPCPNWCICCSNLRNNHVTEVMRADKVFMMNIV